MEFELRMLSEQRKGLADCARTSLISNWRSSNSPSTRIWRWPAPRSPRRAAWVFLRTQSTPSFEDGAAKDPVSLQRAQLQAYDRRQVWFASDEVDLTQALIKYLSVPVDAKPADAKGADGKKGDAQERPGTGAKDGGL